VGWDSVTSFYIYLKLFWQKFWIISEDTNIFPMTAGEVFEIFQGAYVAVVIRILGSLKVMVL